MTVLVTGAGGFIGSHLTEALLRNGHSVRALVRYNGRGDWGHLGQYHQQVPAGLDVRLGDVTDAYLVHELVRGCEVVFHLAALIGIPYSYHAPASYVTTNIGGTLNILEACRQAKVRRVIVTSTSEVYGTALRTPMDEGHPLQAQSPYAATKIAADKLAESYWRTYGLPVVTLRPFNTFGPRQSARAVIPTILSQAVGGADEIRLGSLEPRRDLTFVDDTVRAFLLAADTTGIDGEVVHFGSGTAVSIGELAERCLQVTGSRARIVSAAERMRPEQSEIGLLLCDPSKAQRLLGWQPQVPLEKGLRLTAEYLRSHLKEYRLDTYAV